MRDPFTSLPAPVTVDTDRGGYAPPIKGQLSLDVDAAGHRPPAAVSGSYPYLPIIKETPHA